jgi:hypothetical protein
MLQVKNSVVDIVSGALLTGVIAITSVTNCEAVETISPTFVDSDTSYCVSGDASAVGVGDQINLPPDYIDSSASDYRIAQAWAETNLLGKGYDSNNIAEWAYTIRLVAQGFTLLDAANTLTVPDVGAGVTATNVPMIVKGSALTAAMIAGIEPDWSDLRFSSDIAGTTQLPLEKIIGQDIAWTLVPEVATGTKIYVWGTKPTAVKEIDTAPFGRNAVWVGSEDVRHGNTSADSSGNNANLTTVGTATLNNTGFNGGKAFNGDENSGFFSVGGSNAGSYTLRQWIKFNAFVTTTSSAQRAFHIYDGSDGVILSVTTSDKFALYTFGGNDQSTQASATALTTGVWYHSTCVFDTTGQTITHYLNGSQDRQLTSFTDTSPTTNPEIAYGVDSNLSSSGVDALQQWCSVSYNAPSADQISIEYQNQSANDGWWDTSDTAETGGTGAVVSVTAPQPAINSTGSVTAPPSVTASVSFAGATPTFVVEGVVSASNNTSNVAVTAPQPTFNASVVVAAPGANVSSVSFTLANPVFNVEALVAIPPTQVSTVDFTTTQPTFDLSGSTDVPSSGTSVSFTISAPTFSANLSNTVPVTVASVGFSLDKPTFNVSAAAPKGTTTASGTISLATPVFNTTGKVTVPYTIAEISLYTSVPAFTASGATTTPITTTTVNIQLSTPAFTLSDIKVVSYYQPTTIVGVYTSEQPSITATYTSELPSITTTYSSEQTSITGSYSSNT